LDQHADVPWHRVINAKGEISPRANPDAVEFQRMLLEEEGIGFDHRRCIDLALYAWNPEN
jgi:methylated-DNA-protein-cysteine methyltransferase-like protein